jgi:hypothetical protein
MSAVWNEPGIVAQELDSIEEASEVKPIDRALALAASRATSELREHARNRDLSLPGLGDEVVLARPDVRRVKSSLATVISEKCLIHSGWGDRTIL